MTTRVSSDTITRILRCLPDAGSGETIRAHEIAERLGLRGDCVHQALKRALKRGLVERVRPGDWRLTSKLTVGEHINRAARAVDECAAGVARMLEANDAD